MNKHKLLTVFLLFFTIASHCGQDNSLAEQSINLLNLPREIWVYSLTLSFEPGENIANIVTYQNLSMVSSFFQHPDFFNALVNYLQEEKVSYLDLFKLNRRINLRFKANRKKHYFTQEFLYRLFEGGTYADVNAKDFCGSTALKSACKYSPEIVPLLLEAGADVNEALRGGSPPLMGTCIYGLDSVKFSIEPGPHLNYVDNLGNAILMTACLYNKLDMVELLIEAGADVNAVNVSGKTPLMFACSCRIVS